MKIIAFFNNKGGVGKTSLVYHLSCMYADLGAGVLAADLDPQANLTTMFLPEERLEEIWPDGDHRDSVLGAISPILKGLGDIRATPPVEEISDNLGVLPGDLGLSRFEARLSSAWPECLARDEAAFRVESAFHRLVVGAAQRREADLALVDVGPNLGAINRAAMLAADFVVFPLAPDLFSLQGLRNLGPTLVEWREAWKDRLDRAPAGLDLPAGGIAPAGYVVMQHAVRLGRAVRAYDKWMSRIPDVYRTEVLAGPVRGSSPGADPNRLATLKHYRSLMPMAQEARKPMFHLTAADGALGAHTYAVQDCYEDFRKLAHAIADRCGVTW